MPAKKKLHPNSLKNLEAGKFKKGNKLGGRPKGSISLVDSLARALDMDFKQLNETTGIVENHKVRDWIGIALAAKAMRGDVPAAKEVLDRLEGKAMQKLEVTGDGLKVEHTINMGEVYERAERAFEGLLIEGEKDE
tara:strand:+ start:13601 stop:14008 length:408 start_codon:yes stop_codon:yes gene_type:complete